MKLYSINENPRRTVYFFLIIISLLLTIGSLQLLFDPTVSGFTEKIINLRLDQILGADFHIAYVLGLWGSWVWLVYYVFDSWLWRLFSRLIKIPNLNGVWIGTLDRKEFPSGEVEQNVPVIVTIKQNFLRMVFDLQNPALISASGQTQSQTLALGIDGSFENGFKINQLFEAGELFGATCLELSDVDGHPALLGKYVSSHPRTGSLELHKLSNQQRLIERKAQILTSLNGDSYIGIPIKPSEVRSWRNRLRAKIREKMAVLEKNRSDRDGIGYHMTLVTPPEFADLAEEKKAIFLENKIAFVQTGVGHANRADAESYYVTVNSHHAAFLRGGAGLKGHDFHITLGFDPVDVHDRRKDETTRIL